MLQQIVQIEIYDHVAGTLQLNMTHAPLRGRAAGSKKPVGQGTQRADRVASRSSGLADHKYLNGTQLPHVDVQIEIAKQPTHLRLQIILDLGKFQTGYMHLAHLRNIDAAGTINSKTTVERNLPPSLNQQLVSWPNHIVRSYR